MRLADGVAALARSVLRSIPDPAARSARALRRYLLNRKSPARVFTKIYRDNDWNGTESVSGPGSTLSATKSIRAALPALLIEFDVKSLLDLPCGDAHWISTCLAGRVSYMGGDIVEEIVHRNREQHPELGKFFVCDLMRDRLPRADLILVRDCFIHLPFMHIRAAVDNIKRSGAHYLLTTSYEDVGENVDIEIGGFRKIDLTRPPFDFPSPLSDIPDTDQNGASNKRLMLWHLSSIRF